LLQNVKTHQRRPESGASNAALLLISYESLQYSIKLMFSIVK